MSVAMHVRRFTADTMELHVAIVIVLSVFFSRGMARNRSVLAGEENWDSIDGIDCVQQNKF